MNDNNLRTALIISVVGNILAVLVGGVLSVVNVVTPHLLNQPDLTIRYAEAIPMAEYARLPPDLFLQFLQGRSWDLTMFANQYKYDRCSGELRDNGISPGCKEPVITQLTAEINAQSALVNQLESYIAKLRGLDFRETVRLPSFEGDPMTKTSLDFSNQLLGIASVVSKSDLPEKTRSIAHMLYPIIENVRGNLEATAKVRQTYLSVLTSIRVALQGMAIDRESGKRTGTVYFKLGLHNTGRGDGLVSPIAKLKFADAELPLRPYGNRNSYTIIPAGRVSELWLDIDSVAAPEQTYKSWQAIVKADAQESFRIIVSANDLNYEVPSRLPITEDVQTDIIMPYDTGIGTFYRRLSP
jgi:hypothetical protein